MKYFIIIFICLFSIDSLALSLSTDSFAKWGRIPEKFTCKGADTNPMLSWINPPLGTKSYAIVVDDPDSAGRIWGHWVVFNIPSSTTEYSEGQQKLQRLPDNAVQGTNDFGRIGYNGPCPPPGKTHRYYFRIFALDTRTLPLDSTATRNAVIQAIKDHTLARDELVGTFSR